MRGTLALLAVVTTLGAQAVAAPRLEVETLKDLGEVVRGKTSDVVFELRNSGDEVLTILRAKPG